MLSCNEMILQTTKTDTNLLHCNTLNDQIKIKKTETQSIIIELKYTIAFKTIKYIIQRSRPIVVFTLSRYQGLFILSEDAFNKVYCFASKSSVNGQMVDYLKTIYTSFNLQTYMRKLLRLR